jgi:hypothetical protein
MQGTRGEDRRHDQLSWSCSPPCGPTPPPLTGLPCALLPRSTGGILALVRYHVRGCSGRVERLTSLSMGLSACAREPVSRRRTEPVPRVARGQERDEEWVPGIWLLRWSKPVVSRARRADGMLVVSPDGAGDPHHTPRDGHRHRRASSHRETAAGEGRTRLCGVQRQGPAPLRSARRAHHDSLLPVWHPHPGTFRSWPAPQVLQRQLPHWRIRQPASGRGLGSGPAGS